MSTSRLPVSLVWQNIPWLVSRYAPWNALAISWRSHKVSWMYLHAFPKLYPTAGKYHRYLDLDQYENSLSVNGCSKNSATPKWMVKIMENPIKLDDLRGKPTIFGNTQINGTKKKLPPTIFHQKVSRTSDLLGISDPISSMEKWYIYSTYMNGWFFMVNLGINVGECYRFSMDPSWDFQISEVWLRDSWEFAIRAPWKSATWSSLERSFLGRIVLQLLHNPWRIHWIGIFTHITWKA